MTNITEFVEKYHFMISVKSGNHSMNQINDDHDLQRWTGRPTSSRTQFPSRMTYTPSGCSTAFQDKIRITPEVGRKLNGERTFALKLLLVLTILMRLKQIVGLDEGHLPQVLWNFLTSTSRGYPKFNILNAGNKLSEKFNDQIKSDWLKNCLIS